jgi:drug/metabolite transporter (DMT)-like permease
MAMNIRVTVATLGVVLALAVGQLLFKSTAMAWSGEKTLFSIKVMLRLVPSLAVYGLATLAWIWVLRSAQLKTAYPFMALAFAIVPIGAFYLFGERVTPMYGVGAAFIVVGVVITALSN